MNRRQADPTKRRRQQNDTDEIGPKAWSDPTGQALNVCWSRSRERQHHGLNHGRRTPVLRHQYKTGWKLRYLSPGGAFHKDACPWIIRTELCSIKPKTLPRSDK